MKTTIRADGTLEVSPESELEAYALNQWGIQNFGSGFEMRVPEIKIIVNMSGYDIAPFHLRSAGAFRA